MALIPILKIPKFVLHSQALLVHCELASTPVHSVPPDVHVFAVQEVLVGYIVAHAQTGAVTPVLQYALLKLLHSPPVAVHVPPIARAVHVAAPDAPV